MSIYANAAIIANFLLFTLYLPLFMIPQEVMRLRGERRKSGEVGGEERKKERKKKSFVFLKVP